MKNLKHRLKQPLNRVPTKFVIVMLVVALIGFADASYLSLEHFRGSIPPCTTSGCETVLTSAYATVAGMPVALMGAVFYLFIAIGLFAYLDTRRDSILRVTLVCTVIGLLSSLWFVAVQLFIVHAICQYCMLSALTSTTLFVLACVAFKKYTTSNEQ